MKKILNATKDGVCKAIIAGYHKAGDGNFMGGGSSEILNTAIYEEEEILWSEPFKGQEGQDSKA